MYIDVNGGEGDDLLILRSQRLTEGDLDSAAVDVLEASS